MTKYIVLVTGNNQEVIGKLVDESDHTIKLKDPCHLPSDVKDVDLIMDWVLYNKIDEINFNKDLLLATYTPKDNVIKIYETVLNHPSFSMLRRHADKTIDRRISFLNEIAGNNAIMEIQEKMLDKMTSNPEADFDNPVTPDFPDLKDALTQLKKKKMN